MLRLRVTSSPLWALLQGRRPWPAVCSAPGAPLHEHGDVGRRQLTLTGPRWFLLTPPDRHLPSPRPTLGASSPIRGKTTGDTD